MLLIHLLLSFSLGEPPAGQCLGPFNRVDVVRCATDASPMLRAQLEAERSARANASVARVLLPSNPTVAVTVGRRWNTVGDQATNLTGSLSQRVEVGGQRRKRKDVAKAQVALAESQTQHSAREVVADALLAYFELIAAREQARIVEHAAETGQRLWEVARARAEAGLGTPIQSELVAADAARLRESVALSRGRVRAAQAVLATHLGLDPLAVAPGVQGSLQPLPAPKDLRLAVQSASARPEMREVAAQRDAQAAQVRLLRRERAPSPTISVFAQTDGFNERIVGGGLSIPIPLPFPVGQTNKGEIQAAQARGREAEHRLAAVGRQVSLEATLAFHELETRTQAAAAYSADARRQATQSLSELAQEMEAGRLPLRDALIAQQSLIDLLVRSVEADHALCRASVMLTLASGAAFEGGAQ